MRLTTLALSIGAVQAFFADLRQSDHSVAGCPEGVPDGGPADDRALMRLSCGQPGRNP